MNFNIFLHYIFIIKYIILKSINFKIASVALVLGLTVSDQL